MPRNEKSVSVPITIVGITCFSHFFSMSIFNFFKFCLFYYFSVCLLKFNSQPDATFCLVGVAKDYKLNPRSVGGGFVYAYRMVPSPLGQPNMELVHKTVLDEIPYAMCAFQGKVLIGVGKLLRLYDLGKKKMLRKSENKVCFGFFRFITFDFSVQFNQTIYTNLLFGFCK